MTNLPSDISSIACESVPRTFCIYRSLYSFIYAYKIQESKARFYQNWRCINLKLPSMTLFLIGLIINKLCYTSLIVIKEKDNKHVIFIIKNNMRNLSQCYFIMVCIVLLATTWFIYNRNKIINIKGF